MREWYDSGECAARKWRMCGEKVGSVKLENGEYAVRELVMCGVVREFGVCGVLREWGVCGVK